MDPLGPAVGAPTLGLRVVPVPRFGLGVGLAALPGAVATALAAAVAAVGQVGGREHRVAGGRVEVGGEAEGDGPVVGRQDPVAPWVVGSESGCL